jgi:hypothetical protein
LQHLKALTVDYSMSLARQSCEWAPGTARSDRVSDGKRELILRGISWARRSRPGIHRRPQGSIALLRRCLVTAGTAVVNPSFSVDFRTVNSGRIIHRNFSKF